MLNDIYGRAKHKGRNTCNFKMPSGQSNGLMTDWSQRDEQCKLSTIVLTTFQYFRCVVLICATLAVLGG